MDDVDEQRDQQQVHDQMERVKAVANAVLYEGYLLYPYYPAAIKNRTRWTFGVVYPREYSLAQGGVEPSTMRTECLVSGNDDAAADVLVRFLQICTSTRESGGEDTDTRWEEGIEREVAAWNLRLSDLLREPRIEAFAWPEARWMEQGVIREQQHLQGRLTVAAVRVGEGVYRLAVQIENTTPGTGAVSNRRDAVLPHTLVSTHTLLHARHGKFVSLLDPLPELATQVASCQNQHTWPVLAGAQGERTTLLSSPIILYDYPQIAPESPGPLFDGTEIDELLTLRILTLSDDEKDLLRRGDARGRELLERTEALSHDDLMKLHGTIRELRPVGDGIGTIDADEPHRAMLRVGDRVLLHPSVRADAFDVLLAGKTARIEALQEDFEGRAYFVVTLDDDPGREQEGERILPGHRFFFYAEEVERLEVAP